MNRRVLQAALQAEVDLTTLMIDKKLRKKALKDGL